MRKLFLEYFLQAGQTIHDAQRHLLPIKSSSLEILEELPPDGSRLLVAALETKDQLDAVFSHPYDHEDRYEFDAPGNPHAEVDAVDKDIFDLLPGEVAHPPFLHRLLQLGGCVTHFCRRERSSD